MLRGLEMLILGACIRHGVGSLLDSSPRRTLQRKALMHAMPRRACRPSNSLSQPDRQPRESKPSSLLTRDPVELELPGQGGREHA